MATITPPRRLCGQAVARARLLLCDLFGQAAVVLDRFAHAEVLQLEHWPDLDIANIVMGIGAAPDPFDGLRKRLALQDPVTGDELLGLCEGAVDHGALVAGEPDARAFGAWLKPVAIEHHAGLHHLLVELRHGGEDLLRGHLAGLGVLGGLDHHHESHRRSPIGLRVREPGMHPALPSRRTEPSEIDTRSIFFDTTSLSQCVLDLFLEKERCPFRKFYLDSRCKAESSHDRGRCSQSYTRSECSWSTCSSRGAGLKSRTCFSVINSALP